jgi:PilZ domain
MSQHISASQAEPATPPAKSERRRTARFECRRTNRWRLFATTACSSGEGTVQDISVDGISLIVNSELRPGLFLDLTLAGDDGESSSQQTLVRVRRVTPRGDGSWIVGCTFVKKLSQEELQVWL